VARSTNIRVRNRSLKRREVLGTQVETTSASSPPINKLIAGKILNDTCDQCKLKFAERELNPK